MKLKWFRVRDFQSVRDSGQINIDDITCLVGKNEAGKSALLKALYRLNPVVDSDGKFNVTIDYPRMEVEDYRHEIESGKRSHSTPIQAGYTLDLDEINSIHAVFGPDCLDIEPVLTLSKDYDNERTFGLTAYQDKAISHLLEHADFSEQTRAALSVTSQNISTIIGALQAQEQTAEVRRVIDILEAIKKRNINGYIYDTFLSQNKPNYLYFDEYYQMTGHENIEALQQREANKQLKASDYPLLGLIRLARLKLPGLINPASTIDLTSKLEGASNHLTKQVLKYWSQNRHLRMKFDVRPACPGDPEGMRNGTNIWGGVFDTRHQVTTELGSRSRGFVWFFSFLAWYSDVKQNDAGPLILLLDEPGMTLHAKAQYDLLRYFETELKGSHQLVYTTHSPFMIDPEHFKRVRIVQDKSIDAEQDADLEKTGTSVLTDVFAASSDSLFPLQGALGYEIHQTLFVGPYSVVVEGAADLLFMQAMSALLQEEGRATLNPLWTITPVGGAAKVPTFVALLGTQKGMTIATLIDSQVADQKKIEGLYREKLLKKSNVFTFADFTKTAEADIEDMFTPAFYLEIVNAEFAAQLLTPITVPALASKHQRILQRLESYFDAHPLVEGKFSHYRPARYFNENLRKLAKKIPPETKDRFEEAFRALNALLK